MVYLRSLKVPRGYAAAFMVAGPYARSGCCSRGACVHRRTTVRGCETSSAPLAPRVAVSSVVWQLPEAAAQAFQERNWQDCASILVETPVQTAQCLLVQRTKEPAANLWSFPGGSLHFGESVLDGIARELFEETGLVRSDVMLGSEYEVYEYIAREWHYIILTAVGLARHGVEPVAGDDARRACWVPLRDLMNPNFPSTTRCLETARKLWDRLRVHSTSARHS
jgi:8-oxo-dGTP diphosphatase